MYSVSVVPMEVILVFCSEKKIVIHSLVLAKIVDQSIVSFYPKIPNDQQTIR